ncbi:MAG TPA: hypothetical protein GX527_03800 [Clostridiaceae bacterium]|nr:hypothetical protein [Clostridiaceae bacterium]
MRLKKVPDIVDTLYSRNIVKINQNCKVAIRKTSPEIVEKSTFTDKV